MDLASVSNFPDCKSGTKRQGKKDEEEEENCWQVSPPTTE